MADTLLCRITFYLDQNEQQTNSDPPLSHKVKHCIDVRANMTMHQITNCLGQQLGCGYQQFIEVQIQRQLLDILKNGASTTFRSTSQICWETQMKKILQTFAHNSTFNKQIPQEYNFQNTSELSQKRRSTSRYFQTSFDKFFRNNTQKKIHNHNKQNQLSIYQRSIRMKKKTQQKLQAIKMSKINQQIQNCTFTPKIKDTFQFFNKKNPKFFNQSANQNENKQTRFEKLYKQSIDLREKKKQRLRTLQNQQESKLSELSFIPNINQCSKQICKMKSYASFISQYTQKQQLKTKQKLIQHKEKRKNYKQPQKSKMNCTFHPQLSQNTKKLTQHLPSFFKRLQFKNENHLKQKQKNDNINQNLKTIVHKKNNNSQSKSKSKIRKQFYTIEDTQYGNLKQNDFKSPSKHKKQDLITDIQILQQNKKYRIINEKSNPLNRSHELFNNHKKVIFKAIFNFLALDPHVKLNDFLKLQQVNTEIKKKEISINDIAGHPYIPNFIKELFIPISQELGELQVSLNREQFVWAMEKLFESLDLADKGCLLGWGVKLLPQQIKQID